MFHQYLRFSKNFCTTIDNLLSHKITYKHIVKMTEYKYYV